jgi:hypothetical protein
LPQKPVRDALRALLFNQAARGAGSQQWRSPASDVVKRRAFKQTELFPDRELLGAQFGEVALFAVDLILLESKSRAKIKNPIGVPVRRRREGGRSRPTQWATAMRKNPSFRGKPVEWTR